MKEMKKQNNHLNSIFTNEVREMRIEIQLSEYNSREQSWT